MSASLEPSPPFEGGVAPSASGSPTRWRAVVIATVTALAVGIGLAVGSFLLTTRASAVGAASAYVPADATLYVEMRIEPSVSQDAALRDLLGRFPTIDGLDLARPLFDQLGEVVDDALTAEDAGVSWSEDVATWFDGRLAIALIEMPASAFAPAPFDPMVAPKIPPMVLMAGVTDAEAARAAFERIVAETTSASASFRTTEHRGVTIHVSEGFSEGAWAITDDQLLVAPTEQDIVSALDTRAAGNTMADHEEIAALARALPGDWLAFGIYDFTSAMAAALQAGGPSTAGETLGALLEHQSLRGAFAIAATDAGLAFDTVAEPPTGPFAVENADRGLAAEIPGDALYYAEGANLGPALSALVSSIKESVSVEPGVAEGLRTVEGALGADLEELVTWIGDGAMGVGWDGSQPYGGLVLVPDDRSAAERRLGQLATFARLATMDPSSGISVDEREVGGVTVTSIRWEDSEGMLFPSSEPAAVVVEYALTDNRVLVGFGDRFVSQALELETSESLAASDRYVESVAGLGGPEGTSIGWVDLAGVLVAVEQALGAELDDPVYRADIRPWLLPFDRLIAVSRLEDGLHVQRSVLVLR